MLSIGRTIRIRILQLIEGGVRQRCACGLLPDVPPEYRLGLIIWLDAIGAEAGPVKFTDRELRHMADAP
jgi:hypothetical protein